MGQTQIPGTPGIRDYTIQLRDIDPGLVFPWSMVSKTGAVPSDIGAVGSNNPVFTGHVTVPTPVLPSDAANKNYVDLLANSAGGSLTFQSATQDPPYMPQVGQSWIVPVGATFPDWIGHDASIATLKTTGWAFTQPGTASFGYVIDEGGYFEYDIVHGSWQKMATWPLSYGVKDSFLETMSVPLFIASTASAVNQYNQARFYGSFVEINIPDSTNFNGYSFANTSTSVLNVSGTLPALQAIATQSTMFVRDGASNQSYNILVCHQAAALLGGTNTSVGSFHGQEIIFQPFGPGSHIADITGLYFQLFPLTSDSSVDVAQGVHITSPDLAYGPSYQIGTLYGVRIDDQTVASTATKSYNLYSFGRNSNNVFEGNVTTGPLSVSQASQYFTRIQPPDPPMVSVSGPGVLSGVYNWGLSYLTDRGETEVLVPLNFQNLVLSNNSASVPIPIWPSPAVSSVRVWRTTGTNPGYALQLVATITDNSVRNYMDNVPDSSLGPFATVYNSTGGEIYVDGLRYFSSSVSGGISLGPYSGSLQGYNNVNLGTFTGSAQTTAHGEVNVGNYAGSAATTAAGNTNVGMSAGYSNIDGHRNVNIGLNSGFSNQHGWRNINIGEWMGFDETGSDMFHLGTSTRELMTGNLSAGTLQINTPAGFSVLGPLSCTGMATAPTLRVTTGSASGNVLTDIDGLGTAAWQPLTAASVGLGNVLNLTQITGAADSTLTQTGTTLAINLANTNTWTTMQTFSGGLTGALNGVASGNIPMVTPGASGNVLTSNGTEWTSAPPAGGGGSDADAVVGNEVVGATDSTLTRSGAGTAVSPYTLALNLSNANTWTGMQTFTGGLTGTLTGTATGNMPLITPGASGNVLTSDGTAWTSAASPSESDPVFSSWLQNTPPITGPADTTLTQTGTTLGLNLNNPNTWTAPQTFQGGLTANVTGTLFGEATGNIPYVAPGPSQNVLMSNGTEWVSAAPTIASVWGNITGTLSNQSDLQSALNGKQNSLVLGDLTATFPVQVTGGSGAVVGSGVSISVPVFSGSTPGLTPASTGGTTTFLRADGTWSAPAASGTVTSVGLSLPDIFNVSGSPVTSAGTISATLASESANTVLAAPSGSAGTPSFRSLVPADIPALNYMPSVSPGTPGNVLTSNGSVWTSAVPSVAWGNITGTLSNQSDLSTALAGKEPSIASGTTAQYWRGDKTWQDLTATAVGLGNVLNQPQITGATDSTLTQTGTTLGINLANTNTWTGAQTFTGGLVGALSGTASGNIPMVTPGASGNVLTSNGSEWTSAAAPVTTPAGTGSELQYRAGASTFGAVTGSSVSGGAITLTAPSASTTPLTVKGASSQTAVLTEWKDSAGNSLVQIWANGEIWTNAAFNSQSFQSDPYNGIWRAGNHGNVVNIRYPINLNGSGYWNLDNSQISGTVTRLVSVSDYDTDLKMTVNHNATNQVVIYATSGVTPTLALNPDGGNVGIGTTTPGANLDVNGNAIVRGPVRLQGYTVATLPAGAQGDTAFVTDAVSPTYLLTGGGTTVIPVFYNGSAWEGMGSSSSYAFTQSLVNSAGTVALVNDLDTPGNNKVYGTDGSGVRGWQPQAAGGNASYPTPDAAGWWHSTGTGVYAWTVPTYTDVGAAAASHTHILASATFANQGTTATVLHGNASGNPSWGAIAESEVTNLITDLASKVTANSPITGGTSTKITYDAKGLVTSGASATTADIPDSPNARYCTDAEKTAIGNTSGVNTGDETQATIKTKLGPASFGVDGYLTGADWATFNGKQDALGFTAVPDTRQVNGKALSADITLQLASADFANQGTTSTVLHGNAAGNPSFGPVAQSEVTNLVTDLASKQPINISALPGSDQTSQGPTMNALQAGASITIMDLVILNSSGQWIQTDATSISTYAGMIAIALESKTSGQAMSVALPNSVVRNDAWSWTPGAVLYMSETAGQITATQPTTSGVAIRVIGFALSADVIYFAPSPDYITHV